MTQSTNIEPISRDQRSHATGILLLCGAGLMWSFNGAFIKLLYADGTGPPGATIAFYRSLIAGMFLVPLALRRPTPTDGSNASSR